MNRQLRRTGALLLAVILPVGAIVKFVPFKQIDRPVSPDLAILPNGVPISAPSGSADRELVEWLARPTTLGMRVDLGSPQFEPGTSVPTRTFQRRVVRLAYLLKSFEGIDVIVDGARPGAHVARLDLREVRANWVRDAIKRVGTDAEVADARPGKLARTPVGRFAGPDQITLVIEKRR